MAQGNLEYMISYRDIKYPRVELTTGELLLILPSGYKHDIILEKHKDWIQKKKNFIKECLEDASGKRLIYRIDKEFKHIIHSSIKMASKELDVKVRDVFFRRMKTKWASLSLKKNLTLNTLMKYLPAYLIEYVIFHEMAHIIERRHNDRFWKIVLKKYKNCREMEREMFVYWFIINKNIVAPLAAVSL